MRKMMTGIVCVLAGLFWGCALPARAAVMITDGSAHVQVLSGPQEFTNNGPLQSDTDLFFFAERADYVLPSNLTVNIDQAGGYDNGSLSSMADSTIAAGTQINSYFIHMDVMHSLTFSNTAATLYFDEPILGLIVLDPALTDSDWLGDPDSIYTPAPEARWTLEPADDRITLSNDYHTLIFDALRVGSDRPYADQIRIITASNSIPEPMVLGLVNLFGFGFIGLNRLMKRAGGAVRTEE